MFLNPKYDYCFVRSKQWVKMCYLSKIAENMPVFRRVLPISAPQILKKTGLTIQAHELIAGFPHSISTGNYKLMCL